jgi:hypothetical protein
MQASGQSFWGQAAANQSLNLTGAALRLRAVWRFCSGPGKLAVSFACLETRLTLESLNLTIGIVGGTLSVLVSLFAIAKAIREHRLHSFVIGVVVVLVIVTCLGVWFFLLQDRVAAWWVANQNVPREQAESWDPKPHIVWAKEGLRLWTAPPKGWIVGVNLPGKVGGDMKLPNPGWYSPDQFEWWGKGPPELQVRLHGPGGEVTRPRVFKRPD